MKNEWNMKIEIKESLDEGEERFRENERNILSRIKKEALIAKEEGLVSTLPTAGSKAGYLVYLKQGAHLEHEVDRISRSIHNSLNGRSILYGRLNTHQSLGDYGIRDISSGEAAIPRIEVLERLSIAATNALQEYSNTHWALREEEARPFTFFSNYLHNKDSVILSPHNSKEFTFPEEKGNYGLMELIGKNVAELGLSGFRKSWGRHITLARFNSNIYPNEMEKFNELMGRENSLSDVRHYAKALNVGYFIMNKQGFFLSPYSSIQLSSCPD